MKPTTPRKKSIRRSSRKSSRTKRKSSKSPTYHTLTSNIPLKRKRTSTRSVNKRKSRPPSQRSKMDDSFEVIQKSEKKVNSPSSMMIKEKFQIISNDVQIDEDMIKEFKRKTNDFKTDYLIFGIIGTQSTGKSTLLNSIFNCKFDMLNSKKGRKQTTKGIWGSFIDDKRILVLDIEGSDSMERSIMDQNAENKICTFGLIMTHVLFSKIFLGVWK